MLPYAATHDAKYRIHGMRPANAFSTISRADWRLDVGAGASPDDIYGADETAVSFEGLVMSMQNDAKTEVRTTRRLSTAAMMVCLLPLPAAVQALQPAFAAEMESFNRPGYYSLDLEAPSVRTRGKCVAVGLSILGTPYRSIQLVARLPRAPGSARSAYEAIKIIPSPAINAGRIDVCLEEVQSLLRAAGEAVPVSMEIALFASAARAPDSRDWSGPEYDRVRLSDWMFLPAPVWRYEPGRIGAR